MDRKRDAARRRQALSTATMFELTLRNRQRSPGEEDPASVAKLTDDREEEVSSIPIERRWEEEGAVSICL